MIIKKNVRIPMRDGVRIAADIYLPEGTGQVPALLALSPYGKELQAQALTLPPQARPSVLWNGAIEAGDIRAVVDRGYAHIIADVRGTGGSEGELCGNYDSGGHGEGKDIYDIVEWMAEQPWCDGNVGMIGISYFATVQILGAAENPPHLKAIFVNGGHFDLYELCYHGGVMWMMPRASREGRGGDSGVAVRNVTSKSSKVYTPEQFQQRIQERLNDPDIAHWSDLVHLLHYPDRHELWMDYLLNPLDGPFWQEGHCLDVAHKVTIPAYFQVKWGRGWTVDGSIECFNRVNGFKKLDIQPLPPMQERPFHESHEEMFRWYDYWLKGIDTGIVDEPTINVFVEGAREWRGEVEWPLPHTKWTDYYLRPRHKLSAKPEPLSSQYAHPDGFYQAPATVTSTTESVKWQSGEFLEDTEMTGPAALYVHVEIDTDDTNLIAKLYDVDPSGKRRLVTSGYLKASHRELDEAKSKPWQPHHPHTRAEPVPAGEIIEYAIRMYPFSMLFKAGHRIELELSCNESIDEANAKLLPPDSYHLPSGRATTHKIYRDAEYKSRLVLPVIPKPFSVAGD
ncbi:CocE/NonD family hydrolase [Paenibacillus thalictri]|uniref:CocE/NonD family hydrolase n=1 Tax=Paenibacillus thalictri TaxID=2527873 RepID=A0A4V2J408_9BACL|nr:CocE/NonD family hydrolase [Paenibacillus thalictri]TBL76555.1 CocE/NonD family hydrolase [Paenibacillus thalictri]